ncbi:MAG: T9SS type A sorting domain-containing protein [Flavobacteriales bacterium]|nr:T9SS type A sorting domain-containing protein [Flavobacteriales bacterium]
MKHALLLVALSINSFFHISSVLAQCPTAVSPSGSGTGGDPYLIASFENLLWVSENSGEWDKYFLQMADVDASITSNACFDGGQGWSPIGSTATEFTGSYDGNGHAVNGLFISRVIAQVGLFGRVNGGVLTDLTVQGTISGNGDVGLLVGLLTGLESDPSHVTGCHSSGTVQSTANRTGGLVGYALSACLIENCSSSASVSATTRAGGVIGQAWNSINTSSWMDSPDFMIRNCYGTGDVEATSSANLAGVVGGLIGFVNNYNIHDSYSASAVEGPGDATGWAAQPVGAFAGRLNGIALGAIRRCYATGAVTYANAASPTGNGFIGSPATSCTNCSDNLFDSETTVQGSGVGATAKTTVEMKTLSTFTDSNWDFQCEEVNGTEQIWGINGTDNSGYPFLSNQRYYMSDCPQWTGTTDSQWNIASNWSDGSIPDETDDVYISRYVFNDSHVGNSAVSPATCNNLSIGTNAVFTVDAGKALTVAGDLNNEGTIYVEADATGIGSLITNGSLSGAGNFQMEQYLLGAGDATPNGVFQYVSNSVVGATSATYDAAGTNRLWSANESTQSYPPIADNITSLNIGKGYVARVGANSVVTHSGTAFHTGNIAIPSLTRSGEIGNYGYNLIGNPFPSSVNWVDAVRINVETSLWYRTHTADGVMMVETFNASGGIGTNTGNYTGQSAVGIIPPGQAFWVRVVEGQPEGIVAFYNGSRSHGTQASIYKQEAEEGTVRLHLSNGTLSDETIVHFTTDAEDSYDDFDSQKMWMNNLPQLYTTVGTDSLTINGLFSIETNPIVDLGIKTPTTGDYTITASSITLNEEVWLEDRFLNQFQQLNVNPVYAFASNAGNIGDRFALHFGMMAVGVGGDAINRVSTHVFAAEGMVNVSVGNDITAGTITILDMMGRTVQTASISGTRTVIPTEVATGIYLIRVETAKGAETHRVMLP